MSLHTMKKLHRYLLAFVALTGATVLSAHPTNGHEHKGLRFSSVETTLTFVGGTVATWSVDKGKDDSYSLVITQPSVSAGTHDKDSALSLLTLGIQNLMAASEVEVVSGIKIKKTTQAGEQWTQDMGPGTKIRLESVGMRSGQIVEQNVGLIRVMGTTCTLAVISERVRPGKTPWKSLFNILSNHDTTPPPPYGGGEN
jgi:hypothetical protein